MMNETNKKDHAQQVLDDLIGEGKKATVYEIMARLALRRGISIVPLAHEIGYTHPVTLRSKTRLPSNRSLKLLADYLEIDVLSLYDRLDYEELN